MSSPLTARGSLVVDGHGEPFARVLQRSSATADRLEEAFGLRPGDRIVIALENGREQIETLFATWRLGLQLVAVPPTTSGPTFAGIVSRLSPRAVLFDEGNARLARSVSDWGDAASTVDGTGGGSRRVVALVSRDSNRRPRTRHRADTSGARWEQWLAHVPPAVFFTSGSTSTAKGVPLHWARILDKARAVLGFYDVTPDDRIMPILPLSHVYGLYCLVGALALGADCISYRESASPAALGEGIAQHGATVAICPPIVGAFLFGRHGAPPRVRDRLRVLSMGGAATSREQAERILAGLPRTRIFLSYGLAETYSTICCNEISRPGKDLGSVGPLRFGAFGEARHPATAMPVGHGEVGELCVGGTIMEGYLGPHVDCFTPDGLFRTGDLVRFDGGAMTITGRLKEMINAGGLSISPSEIEEALKGHPDVADCGVFGEQTGGLEVACTAVVLRRSPADDRERERIVDELFDFCRQHLAAKMVPRRILTVDGIPRGALGKVARSELRALCAAPAPHSTPITSTSAS